MTKLMRGDIFEVASNRKKFYFQYIVDDKNCLNGNVIRCFDHSIDGNKILNIDILKNVKTLFFMQTSIKAGIKLKQWEKIGNIPILSDFKMPFFKHTDDVYSEVKKSYKWYIWQPNGEEQFVGELTNEYKSFPYAAVTHPIDVVKIIETGNDYFMKPD